MNREGAKDTKNTKGKRNHDFFVLPFFVSFAPSRFNVSMKE